MPRNHALLGLGLAFVSALAYGANIPFAKLSAEAGVTGPDIVFYRAIMMLALLGGLVVATGGSLAVRGEARGAVIGLGLGTAAVAIAYISSVAFIPVGVATILFYTYPLIILVASPMVDGEPVTPAKLAIFALAFAGLVVAIGPSFTTLDPRGLALAAAAALGATAQFFFAARATRAVDPAVAGFWTQLILVPVAFAICRSLGGPVSMPSLAAAALPVGLTCGLFAIAFAFHLFSARLAPPAALGLVFCAEPVTSIAVATVVLGETLARNQLLGGGLVLAAILASLALESRKTRLA
jgi:drug/metabolite transporter (DMT)-like permease